MTEYEMAIKKIMLNSTDNHICNFILSVQFEPKDSELECVFKNLLLKNDEKEAFYLIVSALYFINVPIHHLNHDCPKKIYENNKKSLNEEKLIFVQIYRLCTNEELIEFLTFMFNVSETSITCEKFLKICSESTKLFNNSLLDRINQFYKIKFGTDFQNTLEIDGQLNGKRPRNLISSEFNNLFNINRKDYYTINEERDNLCLIFNNYGNRKGSEKDVETITKTFDKIKGFRVKEETIVSKAKLEKDLKKYAKEISSNCDMIVCFFMFHGEEGLILCQNKDSIPIEEIINFFSVKNVRNLADKPKIFVFHGCRGQNFQEVIQMDCPTESSAKILDTKTVLPQETLNLCDLFIIYSTLSGHYSLRDSEKGSWFIQTFCKVISQNSKKLSIDEMCTIVNNDYPKHIHENKIISQVCEVRKSVKKFHIFLEKPTSSLL